MTLFGNKFIVNVIKCKMEQEGLLIKDDWVPCEKTHRHTEGELHVKMEAEVGMMQPGAKECLWLPDAGKAKEGSFFRDFRGSSCEPLGIRLWLPKP